MTGQRDRIWPAVLISLIGALILTLVPLPGWLRPWRPSWTALTIVYWLLHEPRRIGLFAAWMVGLVLDTVRGVLLGQNALALVIIGYVVLQFHMRIRVFPIGQQIATVFMLIAMYEFILFWVDGVSGEPGGDWRRWLGVVSSAAVWPLVAAVLNRLRLIKKPAGSV